MLPNTPVASPRVCCYVILLHPPLCFLPSLVHAANYPGQGPPAGRRAQAGPTTAWPAEQPSHGPSAPHQTTCAPQFAAFSRLTRNQMQRADWVIHTYKNAQSGECPQRRLTWYWTQYRFGLGMFMLLSLNSNMPHVPAEGSWRLPRSYGVEDQDFAAHTTEASGNQEAGRF